MVEQNGYPVRLRYGKGLRGRFVIKTQDAATAARREAKLRDVADMLARAEQCTRAPEILREAAAARTDAEFAAYVKVAEDFCEAVSRGKRQQKIITFETLATRWTSGDLARDFPDHVATKKTVDLDASRLQAIFAVSVAPGLRFGALPVAEVSLAHCKTVMANLPKTAKRPGTRRHYAQLIHRVLELAVYPCELVAANPLPRSFMPKVGKPPGFSYLYPNEEAALLSAPSDAVPLCYRVLWGFLAREGCRSGEAIGLRIGHEVDLERGVIALDSNKTDDARAWAMDPAVAAALRRWAALRGAKRGALLFVDEAGHPLQNDKLAGLVRAHLKAAGVTREELHRSGENRGQFRCHDLRATFITLALANGKTETWVQDRTGHTTSVMINRYRRGARSATELGIGGLVPFDQAIPELAETAEGGPEGGPGASPLDRENERNYRDSHDKPKWRNWQTRRTQNPFPAMECRFNPDLRHQQEESAARAHRAERLAPPLHRTSSKEGHLAPDLHRVSVPGPVALRAARIGVTLRRMVTLIETQMRKGYAELTFRCSDGEMRQARLVDQDPKFIGVHPVKWHRALERWSNGPENEPTIYRLQQAVRQGDVTAPQP